MNTIEEILDQYEQLWRDADQPPLLGQFLAASNPSALGRRGLLADLVAIDMEYRWRAASGDEALRATAMTSPSTESSDETVADAIGERPTLENYLRQWPELRAGGQPPVELLAEEFRVRHRWGDRPDLNEYLSRCGDDERLRSALLAVQDELRREGKDEDRDQPEGSLSQAFDQNDHFGRYRVIRQLGRGGMGEVYLAEDTQLERRVALKIPRLGESDLAQKRFVNEAKAAALLHHPSICPVFDAGEINGQPFLTMACIEGQTLRDAWQRDGKPDVGEIATHFAAIAEAMQAAHDAGIVHRDLKPSNVMLTREGQPVVMDFGLAFRGSAVDERLTQTGDAFGSPAYMSPEQIEGDYTKVGPASDIYSLGVMLYEALTGTLPFTGNASLIAVRIARDEPQQPSARSHDCPEELERLCLRMLDKRPAARPASMNEVAAVFREFARRQGPGEPPRSAAIVKRDSGRGRKVRVAAALVGLAIASLVTAAVLVIRAQTDNGEVVIKSFVPDIEVLVKRNGKPVDEIALDYDPVSTTLRTGAISIEVKGVDPDGFRIKNGSFELTKGGTVVVEITPAASIGGDGLAGAAKASGAVNPVDRPKGPSPFARLRREDLAPYQLKVAGGGDPSKAPNELVAVWGDSRLQHEYRGATDVRFSSDGRTLVSCGEDRKIRFWDVDSSELLREINTPSRALQIAISPNQQHVAALFDEGGQCALASFDTATGRQEIRIGGVSCRLFGMDWIDDQSIVCMEDGREGRLSVWSVATGEKIRTFATPPAGVPLVSLTPDRKALAVALRFPVADSFRAAVFAAESGERLYELTNATFTDQNIFGIAWHPSDNSLGIASGAGTVRWDITGGNVEAFDGLAKETGLAWAPDGRLLAACNAEGVAFWKPDRRVQTSRLSSPLSPMPTTLRFSPTGKHIAATSFEGAVLLWDVAAGILVDGFEGHWNAVTSVTVSRDGKHVASSSLDRSVRLWDAATGKETHRHFGHYSDFYDVAFSPNSEFVAASGRAQAGLQIWDVTTHQRKFELPLVISQEGTRVQWADDSDSVMLSTNHPASLRIYSRSTRERLFHADIASEPLLDADYQSASKLLAAACGERLRLWRVGSDAPARELKLEGAAHSVKFSPDGATLLVAGPSINPRLYLVKDFPDGGAFRELVPHDKRAISAAIFDHSGKRIATLDAERRLIVWDSETGEELTRIGLPQEQRYSTAAHHRQLAFAPDNRHILVGNANGTIYVLRLAE